MKTAPRFSASLLALSLALVGLAPAQAATVDVTTADGLIAAINTANTNGGDNTINLNDGTITLMAVAEGSSGLPHIVSGTLTIQNGSIVRSSDGGTPQFRILTVDSGATLNLTNVTLSNGHAPNLFNNNIGGAIRNFGTLTLTNSTLSRNASTNGGGGAIFNTGTLSLTNSTLSGNSTSGGNGGSGGAINNTGGMLTLNQSTVSGNGGRLGGGIFSDGVATLINSTVSGNAARTQGGGIHAANTMTIINSTVSGNVANSLGGGISAETAMTIINSTLSGNTAVLGGGIFIGGAADVNIINSTLSSNNASFSGGVFTNNGTTALINSTVTGNNAGDFGGGLGVDGGTVTLKNTLIAGNRISVVTDPRGAETAVNAGSITSNGNNLIGHSGFSFAAAVFGTVGGLGASDIVATNTNTSSATHRSTALTSILELDTGVTPNIPALKNNGGNTFTVALVSGSPAIDTGNSITCADLATVKGVDQRGGARQAGTTCDIGAFELVLTSVPTVTALSPTSGPTAGGTVVTITGTDLTDATAVKFGTSDATSVIVNSATSITATSPAGTGTVNVTVTTAGGTSTTAMANQFTYKEAQAITDFTSSANSIFLGGSSTLSAMGGASGIAVSFSSNTPGVCTVNGTTVTPVSEGACIVAADQAGNDDYAAAPQMTKEITVLSIETTVPNRIGMGTGDGNGDGDQDNLQLDVESVPTLTGGSFVTVVSAGGRTLTVTAVALPTDPGAPSITNAPLSAVTFVLTGAAVTEIVELYFPLSSNITGLMKKNRLTGNYDRLNTTRTIDGNKIKLVFTITDDDLYDTDLVTLGVISYQVIPVIGGGGRGTHDDGFLGLGALNPLILVLLGLFGLRRQIDRSAWGRVRFWPKGDTTKTKTLSTN